MPIGNIKQWFRRKEAPPVSEFPKEFKKCPFCQHGKTITRLAWEEEVAEGRVGESSKDLPLASRRETIPLIDPKRGIQISARVLALNLDRCAKCGAEYCVRADIITAPVKMPGVDGKFPKDFNLKGLGAG